VTRVRETTWGMGRSSDEDGDGTFDSITSRGKSRSELADTLDGND
jgi:hypothetical protein